ncbi:MAG: cell division protein FtsW [Verrucomicrobia bacterium]|nr:MAG: cell division protein FtsW [Verrucomicrobiota bacterium]
MNRRSVLLLLLAVGALLALGIVMLASTGEFSQDAHGRPYFFVYHQLMWMGLGLGLCLVFSRVDYHFWVKKWPYIYGISLLLLICCFLPHIGAKINGSRRWIRLVGFTFQPSELAKFATVCLLSWWYSQEDRVEREFIRGFFVPLGCVAVLMFWTVIEVDVGSTALIGSTAITMAFIAGSRWRYVLTVCLMGGGGIAAAIAFLPERTGRFLAFLHPEKYPADAYQTQQGLIALGSGGVTGLGLGNGRQKLLYLPFAHTDFIFPVIGEELGLAGTLGVVFAYLIFILAGMSIAVKARDRAGLLMGMGLVMLVAMQAAVNLGVTTELLPNKGLPLPFISYGGSNLAFCLASVGVLLNIYRQGVSEKEEEHMEQMEMALQAQNKVVRL